MQLNPKLKTKKSQSAIEFVILVGVVLFFFTAFFLAIRGNMSDRIRDRQNLLIKEIALTIQDEINLASQSSEGYYREFQIPQKAGGQDYNIEITEGLVYVEIKDIHTIALPVANVTATTINKGSTLNVIKKENGQVKLNPA